MYRYKQVDPAKAVRARSPRFTVVERIITHGPKNIWWWPSTNVNDIISFHIKFQVKT